MKILQFTIQLQSELEIALFSKLENLSVLLL